MEPKEKKIVAPSPYYNIVFGCSNRAFYNVKNELYQIGESVGIETQDGYITEKCDFEGDLDAITIWRGKRSEEFVKAVLKHYGVTDVIPEDMSVVLSIF